MVLPATHFYVWFGTFINQRIKTQSFAPSYISTVYRFNVMFDLFFIFFLIKRLGKTSWLQHGGDEWRRHSTENTHVSATSICSRYCQSRIDMNINSESKKRTKLCTLKSNQRLRKNLVKNLVHFNLQDWRLDEALFCSNCIQ